MNMVAATLLLTIPDEEDAFWVLVCIVEVSEKTRVKSWKTVVTDEKWVEGL